MTVVVETALETEMVETAIDDGGSQELTETVLGFRDLDDRVFGQVCVTPDTCRISVTVVVADGGDGI
ncbi:hypothetical protein L1987_40705 [Smallanthus sonchifolius]|uniref:Uncharacterized protein n=1 Tax=Smallanthus sonchifolius TaxID=185202 RepID=A0ACB9GTC9_9ASTR|nr:hypothetical protein L1987_40705 [Smallanthus sonchifolius]